MSSNNTPIVTELYGGRDDGKHLTLHMEPLSILMYGDDYYILSRKPQNTGGKIHRSVRITAEAADAITSEIITVNHRSEPNG